MGLFFDSSHLPTPSNEYVAWVDVMGTRSTMSRSISASANFISKLHIACLQAPRTKLAIYPVMDGVYAAGQDQQEMLKFLRSIFTQVSDEFNQTTKNQHKFMVRGGLSYGPTFHGNGFGKDASDVLTKNQSHRDALLLGMAIIQAYLSESSAPPFGLFVHESARAFSPQGQKPIPYSYWKWLNLKNKKTWGTIRQKLPEYLKWCSNNSLLLGYPSDAIKKHTEMVDQYFKLGNYSTRTP